MKPGIPAGLEEAHEYYSSQDTVHLEEIRQNLHKRVVDGALRLHLVGRLLEERKEETTP